MGKYGSSRRIPATERVCPCECLKDIAKLCFHGELQSLERNCSISWNQRTLEMKRSYQYPHPERMIASVKCNIIILTADLVPLQGFGECRCRNNYIGTATLRSDL